MEEREGEEAGGGGGGVGGARGEGVGLLGESWEKGSVGKGEHIRRTSISVGDLSG